jgi:hypothetical protein
MSTFQDLSIAVLESLSCSLGVSSPIEEVSVGRQGDRGIGVAELTRDETRRSFEAIECTQVLREDL